MISNLLILRKGSIILIIHIYSIRRTARLAKRIQRTKLNSYTKVTYQANEQGRSGIKMLEQRIAILSSKSSFLLFVQTGVQQNPFKSAQRTVLIFNPFDVDFQSKLRTNRAISKKVILLRKVLNNCSLCIRYLQTYMLCNHWNLVLYCYRFLCLCYDTNINLIPFPKIFVNKRKGAKMKNLLKVHYKIRSGFPTPRTEQTAVVSIL